VIDEKLLKPEERAVYALRSLYDRYGYAPYKMSKFEEYDLYARNKDFLISEGIITFTDTKGKLLALKPDVTLSIIKNSRDADENLSKVYYNENVYRIAKGSHVFKEIMQTGLECIGAIDAYHVAEVVSLAVRSLAVLSNDYMLDLSHVGLISAMLEPFSLDKPLLKQFLSAVEQKNAGALASLAESGALSEKALGLATVLLTEYRSLDVAEAALAPYLVTETAKAAYAEFSAIYKTLDSLGLASRVRIDFSVINHRGYYSGVVFKGYVKGVPDSVLAGGQYDRMMRKMGRRDGAIGFAVYLDAIASGKRETAEYDVDILLLRNGADSASVLASVEKLSADGARVLVTEKIPEGLRVGKIYVTQGKEVVLYGND